MKRFLFALALVLAGCFPNGVPGQSAPPPEPIPSTWERFDDYGIMNRQPANLLGLHRGVWQDVAERCLKLAPGTYPPADEVEWFVADSIINLDEGFYAYGLTFHRSDPESGEFIGTSIIIEGGQWFEPWVISHESTHALSLDRKSTRLNSSHIQKSRMPSSA